MKFVEAKCPNCGGVLKVDEEKDAAICEYCGQPFVVEKAVKIKQKIVNNVKQDNEWTYKAQLERHEYIENSSKRLNRGFIIVIIVCIIGMIICRIFNIQ